MVAVAGPVCRVTTKNTDRDTAMTMMSTTSRGVTGTMAMGITVPDAIETTTTAITSRGGTAIIDCPVAR